MAVAVVATVLLTSDHTPASDWAVIESRVRDVGTRWTPTEGAWSRYGWNHPGPLLFWVLAVPYRLGGSDPDLLRVGALATTVVALAAAAVLLWRAGRAALAVGALAVSFALLAAPTHVTTDYWNPSPAFLATFAVLLASWACLDGWRPAPVFLLVGWTWVAQAHLSYGVVLIPAVVIGVVAAGHRAWREPAERRALALGAGVSALLWVPALLDSVLHPPGNLYEILRWSVQGGEGEATAGLATGVELIGSATDLGRPPWEGLPAFISVVTPTWTALSGGLLLLLVAAGAVAVRRGLRSERNLVAVCLASWCWSVLAVSRVAGPLYSWIFWWLYALVAVTWLAIGLVAVRLVMASVPRREEVARAALPAACGLAVALLAVTALGSLRSDFYWHPDAASAVVTFTDAAERWLPDRRVALDFAGQTDAAAVYSGLVTRLKRGGVTVLVPAGQEPQFGRRHARSDLDSSPALLVRAETVFEDVPPGYEVLSVVDPLADAERSELGQLVDRLTAVFVEAGWESRVPFLGPGADLALIDAPPAVVAESDAVRRVAELASRGDRLVLYARDPLP